ncbi:uncharacterized protein LOC110817059 [Carica papaya]|uniref:uncharacterized protein LOC110817059 n=1 Tax=Carica papaya TaxID=3649 RepID=UPI000B8C6E1C|nr:uncharacterized protein LOC110817059 [Carica papaya]
MATTQEKATACCNSNTKTDTTEKPSSATTPLLRRATELLRDWGDSSEDPARGKRLPMATLIRPVESLADSPPKATSTSAKGIQIMPRAQTSHPLDPLSAAEISVAVATVRAAGATAEVRDSMRFIEVALVEPSKQVVALADAYFFPPFQPSLLPRTKGGPVIPTKLPPRQARLVVYNKRSNETSVWTVELLEVHAATRGGHHRGKVISSRVVPNVQPPMDAVEYAECEAVGVRRQSNLRVSEAITDYVASFELQEIIIPPRYKMMVVVDKEQYDWLPSQSLGVTLMKGALNL